MQFHILYSQNTESNIALFEVFDANSIREEIKQYLADFPTDTIELQKELSHEAKNGNEGNETISFYKVNPKNSKPSICFFRGNETHYVSLTD